MLCVTRGYFLYRPVFCFTVFSGPMFSCRGLHMLQGATFLQTCVLCFTGDNYVLVLQGATFSPNLCFIHVKGATFSKENVLCYFWRSEFAPVWEQILVFKSNPCTKKDQHYQNRINNLKRCCGPHLASYTFQFTTSTLCKCHQIPPFRPPGLTGASPTFWQDFRTLSMAYNSFISGKLSTTTFDDINLIFLY